MTEQTPSREGLTVAALLAQRSRADGRALLDELVALLSDTVPGVRVERALLRRHITSVRMPVGEFVYELKLDSRGSFVGSRQHDVRGVVIRTVPLEIDAFLEELGLALDVELRRTEQGRKALQKWLSAMTP